MRRDGAPLSELAVWLEAFMGSVTVEGSSNRPLQEEYCSWSGLVSLKFRL